MGSAGYAGGPWGRRLGAGLFACVLAALALGASSAGAASKPDRVEWCCFLMVAWGSGEESGDWGNDPNAALNGTETFSWTWSQASLIAVRAKGKGFSIERAHSDEVPNPPGLSSHEYDAATTLRGPSTALEPPADEKDPRRCDNGQFTQGSTIRAELTRHDRVSIVKPRNVPAEVTAAYAAKYENHPAGAPRYLMNSATGIARVQNPCSYGDDLYASDVGTRMDYDSPYLVPPRPNRFIQRAREQDRKEFVSDSWTEDLFASEYDHCHGQCHRNEGNYEAAAQFKWLPKKKLGSCVRKMRQAAGELPDDGKPIDEPC